MAPHENDNDESLVLTDEMREEIGIKIVHLLRIYPIISPTMLQGGLGPQLKPALWRPVLAQLVEDGTIVSDSESLQTPTGRYNDYAKLSLADG